MPPIEINDPDSVARVTTVFTVASTNYVGEITTGFYVGQVSGMSPEDVYDAIDVPLLAWYGATTADGLRAVLTDEVFIARTEVTKPLVVPPPVAHEVVHSGLGGATGDLLPPEVAMVISLKTDTGGPAYRGRMYVGGLNRTVLTTTGGFASATAAALQADAQTLIGAIDLLSVPMVVVSTKEVVGGITVDRDPPLMTAVLTAFVDTSTDTQRRRGLR